MYFTEISAILFILSELWKKTEDDDDDYDDYEGNYDECGFDPYEGCYTYDTRNTIISIPKGKVAIINGLRDYIIVDTEDVLMICPRSDEQKGWQ